MGNVGDIYRIRDSQSIGSFSDLYNIWFYRAVSGTPSANDLAVEFENTVLPAVGGIQPSALDHNSLEVDNLFDIGDSAFNPVAQAGLLVGNILPTFVALTFQFIRQNKTTRHGWKRIIGPTEDEVSGNGIIPAFDATVAMTGAVMGQNLVATDADYEPVIVGRIKYTTSSGSEAYRLPANSGEAIFQVPASVSYRNVSTQNSRKGLT